MFYVYKLLNPLKQNQVFYVGKGQDGRAYRHFRSINWKESTSNPHKTNILRQIKAAGLEPSIEIITCNSEQDAFDLECSLISQYGRELDGGVLTNICLGGEGQSCGHIKVHQYTVFREFVTEHTSLKAAALSVGVNNSSSIVQACKKKGSARVPHGFVWCYADDKPDWNWAFMKIKPVYQWNHDGEVVGKHKSFNDMFMTTGVDVSIVKLFISTTNPKSYPAGFQWSHDPVFPNKRLTPSKRKKSVICLDNMQTFESCAAAERQFTDNPAAKNIAAACSGRTTSAYGHKWSYYL